MSIKHPIIVVTGSSGAGTTTVKHTFEGIFWREKVNAAIVEGDSFHRYTRGEIRQLIADGVTCPARLGIQGGSNGGLLMGNMTVMYPELFGAVVCQVPLLDMIRFQHFLMARYWVPEYGDAEKDPAAMGWIGKYSPYQNIKAGKKLPGIMFTAGDNDSRTHPLHARKMAASMQAVAEKDGIKRPILLWVDRDAGHGQGKPLNLRIRDAADTRMFIMWQLGMLPLKPDQLPDTKTQASAFDAVDGVQIALRVEGMTCELCAGKVRNALLAVPGVGEVDVDLKGKSSKVALKKGQMVEPKVLIAAVEHAGFKAVEK